MYSLHRFPKVYIGQMGRCLKLRLKEHHRALKNGDVAASAVVEQTRTTGHGMDLTKSTVLDCHPHTTTRCLLESWHIQRRTDNLNRERGTLSEVYTALLDWPSSDTNIYTYYIIDSTACNVIVFLLTLFIAILMLFIRFITNCHSSHTVILLYYKQFLECL